MQYFVIVPHEFARAVSRRDEETGLSRGTNGREKANYARKNRFDVYSDARPNVYI